MRAELRPREGSERKSRMEEARNCSSRDCGLRARPLCAHRSVSRKRSASSTEAGGSAGSGGGAAFPAGDGKRGGEDEGKRGAEDDAGWAGPRGATVGGNVVDGGIEDDDVKGGVEDDNGVEGGGIEGGREDGRPGAPSAPRETEAWEGVR